MAKDWIDEWVTNGLDPNKINDQNNAPAREKQLLKDIVSHAAEKKTDFVVSNDALWGQIQQQIEHRRQSSNFRLYWQWAAVGLFFIGASWWLLNQTDLRVHETGIGEVQSLTLPAGSEVNLGAASTLTYNLKNWDNDRQVTLEGEAFFRVQKGVPFIVSTDLGKVEVLGTSFNVHAIDDVFEVACLTGHVRVKAGDHYVELGRAEVAFLDQGNLMKHGSIDPARIGSWQKQIVYISDKTLKHSLSVLARYYDYEFIIDEEIELLLYTGFFKTSDLEAALQSICSPLSLVYSIDESSKTVRIRR